MPTQPAGSRTATVTVVFTDLVGPTAYRGMARARLLFQRLARRLGTEA